MISMRSLFTPLSSPAPRLRHPGIPFTLLPKMAQTRKRKVIGEEARPVHTAIADWSHLLHPKSLSAKGGELHRQFQVLEF